MRFRAFLAFAIFYAAAVLDYAMSRWRPDGEGCCLSTAAETGPEDETGGVGSSKDGAEVTMRLPDW